MRTALALVKPRYHLSFVTVAVGALLFADPIDGALALQLAMLYLSFNLLLYGGIYTFNDIADRAVDARHPAKKMRPIAAGRVSVAHAAVIGTVLCVSGGVLGVLVFPAPILACYGAILALNAAPHAIRFLMGAMLAGRAPRFGHLVAWFCLAAGISCVRRLVEKETGGESARPVLRRYSVSGLALTADAGLAIVLALSLRDGLSSPGFYAIVLTAYVFLVVCARRVPAGHVGFERLWLR
jgi:hypothetical protein